MDYSYGYPPMLVYPVLIFKEHTTLRFLKTKNQVYTIYAFFTSMHHFTRAGTETLGVKENQTDKISTYPYLP